jgi:acetylornithine deacetylase
VDGQDWTVPPFEMSERDGRLYGRGSADMKGFVACAVSAMLRAAESDLATPLHLALSYDEEIGCVGVRDLIDDLEQAPFRPLFCIVGEPTGLSVATGHKGKTALRATCTGREAHSALAPTAVNAIHLATDFVRTVRTTQAEIVESGARDTGYEIPYSTLHVGTIAGGVALNIVPNHCRLDLEIRTLAADDPERILDRLRAGAAGLVETARQISPEADIAIEVTNSYPGLDTPLEAEVVRFVKTLAGAGAPIKISFGTEGGLFDRRLGLPVVVCGPGSMNQGHKPDEYVTWAQLDACDAMLEALLSRLALGLS